MATQPATHQQETRSHPIQWRPPKEDVLKLNIDASWSPANRFAVIGIIVRDSSGYLVSGLAKRIPAASPMAAEALALREAIHLAHNL
ncbi:Reverse transcriptase-like [Sesbania bispinosa]|nr:Reverse transcriptase-like [Sesbania bispinosa]